MAQFAQDKRGPWACCAVYSFVCFGVALAFSIVLGLGVSDDYGGEREPSYGEAARMAGYFDSDGVYQGGLAKWRDWSEDSYSCSQQSQNGKYCQAWTTDRYYSDPEHEFLKGNCTCIRPLDSSVEATFDVWYNIYEDFQTTSSSDAALQDADFCSAWNCQETRYTQQCTCSEYETRTTCRRRQLRTNRGGSSNSCSTREVCVALDCVYLESNFYTACDCDSNGERRAQWGPGWWRESTHCEEFTCLYGYTLNTMSESFALASSATEDASLPPAHASLVPDNATTVVTGILEGFYAMDYACTKGVQGNGSSWCGEWSGITRGDEGEVVEQLCGCTTNDGAENFSEYCEVCRLEGVGVVIAGLIVMGLIPLYSCVARGQIAPPILATPFGVAAAALVAMFFGGWVNVWSSVVPAFFVAVFMGWCIGKCRPSRIDPQPVPKVKDHGDTATPLQTPMPVTSLAPGLPQAYQPTGLAAGPVQQPGISYGITPAAQSYTPPGGQQQPMQYSAPTGPGGFNNPPAAYGGVGTVEGAYGRGFQSGIPSGAPPPNQYGYQSPPQFKTGVGGGRGGY